MAESESERNIEHAAHALAHQLAAGNEDLLPFLLPISAYLTKATAQRQEEPARSYAHRCQVCGVPLETAPVCVDCLAGGMG
jgi:hypothetical protein